MKIALVVPDITVTGGTEKVVENLYENFQTLKYKCEIVSLFSQNSLNDTNNDGDDGIIHLNINKPKHIISRFLRKKSITKKINFNKYDIVIGNNFYRYYATPIKGNTKNVEIQHMSYEESMLNFSVKKSLAIVYRNRVYKKLDKLVTLTNRDKDKFLSKGVANTICIENGLSFYPETTAKLNTKNAIAIGRLTSQKGFDILIPMWHRIIQKYPDWKLEIYGEGEQQNSLNLLIKQYNLTNYISILPFTNNIQQKILDSSILLFPSRYEGFPLTIIEAMSCGVPCISFDINSGPSDIIQNEHDGFIVPAFDQNLFIEKIEKLIKSEKLRKSLGIQARENIKRYNWSYLIKKWQLFLESLNSDLQSKD